MTEHVMTAKELEAADAAVDILVKHFNEYADKSKVEQSDFTVMLVNVKDYLWKAIVEYVPDGRLFMLTHINSSVRGSRGATRVKAYKIHKTFIEQ